MRPPAAPPPSALPTKKERQEQLREYVATLLRSLFKNKGELFTLGGLERLRLALIEDLRTALVGLGLTAEAAGELAVEAVGVALARGAARKVLGWLKE